MMADFKRTPPAPAKLKQILQSFFRLATNAGNKFCNQSRTKLIGWINRLFPSEAAHRIIHHLRLANLPKPPRLMTINKWGLRAVYVVLILQSLSLLSVLLLNVWLGGDV